MPMPRLSTALTWLCFIHRFRWVGFRSHPAVILFFRRLCQIHLWNPFRTVAALAATEAQHGPSPGSSFDWPGCHYDGSRLSNNECNVASAKQEDSRYQKQKRVSEEELVKLFGSVRDWKQKRCSHRCSRSCSNCVRSCRSLCHPDPTCRKEYANYVCLKRANRRVLARSDALLDNVMHVGGPYRH